MHFLALGFGAGCVPRIPGTCGSLVGVLFFLPLSLLERTVYFWSVGFFFLIGIVICGQAAHALNDADHPAIVWDEMVGFWLTLAWVFTEAGWLHVLLGFFLFRLFDILKPWPINIADQRVTGGFGIMLDDLMAALYAGFTLWTISYLGLPDWGWR